ncbi:MAG: putative Mevalonate kinase [Promethearchaeota archaeon]|nr:MAG: putative Mevalonate kinase [Candidatus Lokiarchaeota archaeon]
MKSIIAVAPGKCILFGEHAVVYGYPAIAMALDKGSKCNIRETKYNKIEIHLINYNEDFEGANIENLKQIIPQKYAQISKLFSLLSEYFQLEPQRLSITISSNLFPGAGLGSSASIAASLLYAFNCFYELHLQKTKVNELAYELEQIIHGTPSGIDNTICTYGKSIYFQNGTFSFMKISEKIRFLITYTNIEHDTKEAITRLRNLRQEQPKKTNQYLKEIGKICKHARRAIKNNDFDKIGELMNENQDYLSKLQLSNKKIQEITSTALNNGALGSKLTGAGLGGCVISLGEEEKLLDLITILQKKGYKSFIAKNDQEGVRCEKK